MTSLFVVTNVMKFLFIKIRITFCVGAANKEDEKPVTNKKIVQNTQGNVTLNLLSHIK